VAGCKSPLDFGSTDLVSITVAAGEYFHYRGLHPGQCGPSGSCTDFQFVLASSGTVRQFGTDANGFALLDAEGSIHESTVNKYTGAWDLASGLCSYGTGLTTPAAAGERFFLMAQCSDPVECFIIGRMSFTPNPLSVNDDDLNDVDCPAEAATFFSTWNPVTISAGAFDWGMHIQGCGTTGSCTDVKYAVTTTDTVENASPFKVYVVPGYVYRRVELNDYAWQTDGTVIEQKLLTTCAHHKAWDTPTNGGDDYYVAVMCTGLLGACNVRYNLEYTANPNAGNSTGPACDDPVAGYPTSYESLTVADNGFSFILMEHCGPKNNGQCTGINWIMSRSDTSTVFDVFFTDLDGYFQLAGSGSTTNRVDVETGVACSTKTGLMSPIQFGRKVYLVVQCKRGDGSTCSIDYGMEYSFDANYVAGQVDDAITDDGGITNDDLSNFDDPSCSAPLALGYTPAQIETVTAASSALLMRELPCGSAGCTNVAAAVSLDSTCSGRTSLYVTDAAGKDALINGQTFLPYFKATLTYCAYTVNVNPPISVTSVFVIVFNSAFASETETCSLQIAWQYDGAPPSPSPTPSTASSPSASASASAAASGSPTSSPSSASTPTASVTPFPSSSASITPTASVTPSATESPSGLPTPSGTPSATPSLSSGASPSVSASVSTTPSLSASPTTTNTVTASPTASLTARPSQTTSPSSSPSGTPTATRTPSASPTGTTTPSGTPTRTPTASGTPTRTPTASPSASATQSSTPSAPPTSSPSSSVTPTAFPTPTPTTSALPPTCVDQSTLTGTFTMSRQLIKAGEVGTVRISPCGSSGSCTKVRFSVSTAATGSMGEVSTFLAFDSDEVDMITKGAISQVIRPKWTFLGTRCAEQLTGLITPPEAGSTMYLVIRCDRDSPADCDTSVALSFQPNMISASTSPRPKPVTGLTSEQLNAPWEIQAQPSEDRVNAGAGVVLPVTGCVGGSCVVSFAAVQTGGTGRMVVTAQRPVLTPGRALQTSEVVDALSTDSNHILVKDFRTPPGTYSLSISLDCQGGPTDYCDMIYAIQWQRPQAGSLLAPEVPAEAQRVADGQVCTVSTDCLSGSCRGGRCCSSEVILGDTQCAACGSSGQCATLASAQVSVPEASCEGATVDMICGANRVQGFKCDMVKAADGTLSARGSCFCDNQMRYWGVGAGDASYGVCSSYMTEVATDTVAAQSAQQAKDASLAPPPPPPKDDGATAAIVVVVLVLVLGVGGFVGYRYYVFHVVLGGVAPPEEGEEGADGVAPRKGSVGRGPGGLSRRLANLQVFGPSRGRGKTPPTASPPPVAVDMSFKITGGAEPEPISPVRKSSRWEVLDDGEIPDIDELDVPEDDENPSDNQSTQSSLAQRSQRVLMQASKSRREGMDELVRSAGAAMDEEATTMAVMANPLRAAAEPPPSAPPKASAPKAQPPPTSQSSTMVENPIQRRSVMVVAPSEMAHPPPPGREGALAPMSVDSATDSSQKAGEASKIGMLL
jgi:hypothetical protein